MLITDRRIIGNKILKYRKARGITQEKAAELSSVSSKTFAEIERGNKDFRIDTLLKICAALNITPNDLLFEEDPEIRTKYVDILDKLNSKDSSVKETAINLLEVFLDSTD